jgi:tryptophanyl-tRNA synthetase
MSKSYNNTICLRESPDAVREKLRTMPTDPARVRRTDPGNPDICPVWQLHEVYSGEDVKDWVRSGCTSAGIGCLDCKQPVIESILAELGPLQARAREFEQNPGRVRSILNEGTEVAREMAQGTLEEVRRVMGLDYS